MANYAPGEIIVVNYPFKEDPTLFKPRPAMIISKISEELYCIAKITTKNQTGRYKGEWIDENSKEYEPMGIGLPSFIFLEQFIQIPITLIKYPIGRYPDVHQLFKIHNLVFQAKKMK